MNNNINIGFISLGCPKNQVDLEKLAGSLLGNNVTFRDDPAECDIMIINTCGFISSAISESIENILTVKAQLPAHAKLIAFGCMVERFKEDVAQQLPEVDFWSGVGEKEKIIGYIKENTGFIPDKPEENSRYLFNYPYYAYLKISEGCNNRCTYCTIPSLRGNLISVNPQKVLEEARQLAANGAREIIIVSQDSTKYGSDLKDGSTLASLLERLSKDLPGCMFRIMYLNPDGVTEELIHTVQKCPNIIRYFDIPVQHISDKILRKMNRKSNKKQIENVFEMIRRKLPDAFIRTTGIVGFPGETEEDFQEMVHFLTDYKPDYAGFFPYSPEDGTPAAVMVDQTEEKTVKKRVKTLQSIQKKNTLNRLKQLKKEDILCFAEKPNDDFSFILEGRAIFQAPEVDGQLYVTDGTATDGYGPYRARIVKIVYPDIYVKLTGTV